jgi:hypothetical protein
MDIDKEMNPQVVVAWQRPHNLVVCAAHGQPEDQEPLFAPAPKAPASTMQTCNHPGCATVVTFASRVLFTLLVVLGLSCGAGLDGQACQPGDFKNATLCYYKDATLYKCERDCQRVCSAMACRDECKGPNTWHYVTDCAADAGR